MVSFLCALHQEEERCEQTFIHLDQHCVLQTLEGMAIKYAQGIQHDQANCFTPIFSMLQTTGQRVYYDTIIIQILFIPSFERFIESCNQQGQLDQAFDMVAQYVLFNTLSVNSSIINQLLYYVYRLLSLMDSKKYELDTDVLLLVKGLLFDRFILSPVFLRQPLQQQYLFLKTISDFICLKKKLGEVFGNWLHSVVALGHGKLTDLECLGVWIKVWQLLESHELWQHRNNLLVVEGYSLPSFLCLLVL